MKNVDRNVRSEGKKIHSQSIHTKHKVYMPMLILKVVSKKETETPKQKKAKNKSIIKDHISNKLVCGYLDMMMLQLQVFNVFVGSRVNTKNALIRKVCPHCKSNKTTK